MIRQRWLLHVGCTFAITVLYGGWSSWDFLASIGYNTNPEGFLSLTTNSRNAAPLHYEVEGKKNETTASSTRFDSTTTMPPKNDTNQHQHQHRYSYFMLLAGVRPFEYASVHKANSYVGYLLNLAATRYMLDRAGAKSDFNILMSFHGSLSNVTINDLPQAQRDFLATLSR
jgi:hypothetical protein